MTNAWWPELLMPAPVDRPGHRLRDDPLPDELGQAFCVEDETLCQLGRPCACCWAEIEDEMETERGR